ncbi:creatininase family protein [Paracoccus gahaiensis]|uniref:Creatininase family protein n=1 Tax=Paracoccus gahaiensis TaxID=1706839 RepID=A0A4U0R5N3_9RHOB|nr:creatininase family protein [Paracoccus gahaiensis]TJZ90157.1 creatininase family protein [Paracoccus gahaiensis]
MTVAEFRDRLAEEPVILLPLGSHEEQGPHAPMGDYLLAEAIALRAAELSGAVAAPCLPFGHADFFRGFPGGIQLRAPTFRAVLTDMIEAFLDHGLPRILILNGHSTNAPLIDEVARGLRRQRGVAVASVDLWRSIPDALWTQIYGADAARARGHGGDPVTSVSMYLRPDMMRPDLIRHARPATAMGLPVAGVGGVRMDGLPVNLPLDAHEVNGDGMLGGDAALASAAAGQAIFNHLAGHCAAVARHLSRCDPCQPMSGPISEPMPEQGGAP